MTVFDTTEYEHRLDLCKKSMEQTGVDLILATNPANMNYLTGYDGWSFYVHQLVLLAGDSVEPVWIGRGMDANAAKVTTFLDHQNILGYSDDYVQSSTKHPMDYVCDFIKSQGKERATIGVEMDSYYFTAACFESLKRNLPDATFRDTTTLVNRVRMIKSPQEIRFMREAAKLVELAMAAGIENVTPGTRQCDAVAAIYQAQIAGTSDFGGDYTAICPMLPTGAGTSTPHLTWSDQPFQSGEATILELAGARHHYHCPMARTVHLGAAPKRLVNTAKVVIEGLNNALDAAKPGVRCEEVEAAWRDTIARHGIVKDSRIGYSTGVNYPPDWGEGTLSLRPGDKTELQPGMTIHMIPGVWMDDWGIEISECFEVTETGSQRFCGFPQDLVVK